MAAKSSLNRILSAIIACSLLSVQPALAASNECADGIDNDFDGYIDYPQDGQCLSLHDESEGPIGRGVFLRITDGLETAEPAGHLTYTIGVRTERDEQKNVDVHLFIPHQTNFIEASNAGRREGDYVVWRNVTVYPGQERKLFASVSVTPHAREDLLVVAEVSSEGEKALDTTRIKASTAGTSRLRVSITDNKKTAEPNENLNYTIRVENPNGPAQKFRLRAELSPYLHYERASHQPRVHTQEISWENQDIGHNEYREYTLVAKVDRETPDNYPIKVTASTRDGHARDTTHVYTGVTDDGFTVSVTDGVDTATPGDTVTYAISIRNNTRKLATEVDVNNALPSYTEFVDASEGGQWTGTKVRWNGLTVSPEGSRTLFVTARVRSDAPYGGKLRNSVEVRGHNAVDNTGIGTSRIGNGITHDSISRKANITVQKRADRNEVRPGDTVRYTIYIRNNTSRAFNNIEVRDRMNQNYMTVLGSESGHNTGAGINWRIPTLAPGEDWAVDYTVRIADYVPHGMDLQNVVSVSGNGIETLSLNERVVTSNMGVITNLPPTGASMGAIFAGITALLSTIPASLQRKRFI